MCFVHLHIPVGVKCSGQRKTLVLVVSILEHVAYGVVGLAVIAKQSRHCELTCKHVII